MREYKIVLSSAVAIRRWIVRVVKESLRNG